MLSNVIYKYLSELTTDIVFYSEHIIKKHLAKYALGFLKREMPGQTIMDSGVRSPYSETLDTSCVAVTQQIRRVALQPCP